MALQTHIDALLEATPSTLREQCALSTLRSLRSRLGQAYPDNEKTLKLFVNIDQKREEMEIWLKSSVKAIIRRHLPETENVLVADLENCSKKMTWETKLRGMLSCKHVYDKYETEIVSLVVSVKSFCRRLHSEKHGIVEQGYYVAKRLLPLEAEFGSGIWAVFAPFGVYGLPNDTEGMILAIRERQWLMDLICQKSPETSEILAGYNHEIEQRQRNMALRFLGPGMVMQSQPSRNTRQSPADDNSDRDRVPQAKRLRSTTRHDLDTALHDVTIESSDIIEPPTSFLTPVTIQSHSERPNDATIQQRNNEFGRFVEGNGSMDTFGGTELFMESAVAFFPSPPISDVFTESASALFPHNVDRSTCTTFTQIPHSALFAESTQSQNQYLRPSECNLALQYSVSTALL